MKSTGIIAFCGSKGSGKSTSYNLFKGLYSGEIEEVALAGHLKEVCSKVFGLDMKYFTEPNLKEVELDTYVILKAENIENIYKLFNITEYDILKLVRPHIGQVFDTPRRLLQYIGTELLHPIDPLIHAKIALSNKSPDKLTVVTDLRFINEFNFLKETLGNEFVPVYVKCSSAELLAENDSHPSERELQLFKNQCYQINNEGGLTDLDRQLNTLIRKLFKETTNDGENLKTSGRSEASNKAGSVLSSD